MLVKTIDLNRIQNLKNGNNQAIEYFFFVPTESTCVQVDNVQWSEDNWERFFASDFSEKYKVKPLALSDEAKIALTKYRFPGNIRQLKNLVEQISVLEINREINSEKLLKYLPSDSNYLPALYKQQPDDAKAGLSERELLYKVLFDMRKDVNELKKLVHGMINEDIIDQNGIESTAPDIFRREPEPAGPPTSVHPSRSR